MRQPQDIVLLLKAAGEVTRLRLLALLVQGELSVKDFTEILGQSQPRISRHLKLLADAGLVTRHAEGAWAYYRLNRDRTSGPLADWLMEHLDTDAAELRRDIEKLSALRVAQQDRAAAYFATIAQSWDRLRSLHVADSALEAAIVEAAGQGQVNMFLDLGTGTGRMLELLEGKYAEGIGLDSSREMLSVARAKLDAEGIENAQVRLGNITELDDYRRTADLVMLHQVLHYFDDPSIAIGHAAACLKPEGRMLVVDFAPHDLEFLRTEQAHRRLGMSEEQMALWARAAGLAVASCRSFPPSRDDGLTVCLWVLETIKSNDKKGV
ncbi:ArsR/SmtB family transcription factor [Pelagibacterium halotolerans]|uniref:Transcriptional regulator, ArsR family / methyltransferase fusion n=1 Tax=Pelagibacterium halotolerans (strain DSM 22347 / JCM 15775 / CGMCC 1.7692 / B2) TaxID=1082931 RepID=G4RG08_PELHB|nr:metalloregulator ArsR/SmtB family transcription factor [Pelagibacterium halotolerans]AEQ52022.1 transcriptional regulator, ArsR family / methyltransferase fusion [Pelagibacterium halotolerans B2]QJR18198.1 metalloregulator ArsR/SmtB family transcription factor [Pelagibacterium halotolerans]SDZ81766.1 transcriptional regulator, ArsR family [Pelagibacterium halotolerans]